MVHDKLGDIKDKLKQASIRGYALLGYSVLGEETWWNECYAPLEKRIHQVRMKHADNPEVVVVLDAEQRETGMFKQNPGRYCSVYFVMKKR